LRKLAWLLTLLGSAPLGAESLRETVSRYERAALSPEAVEVAGARLTAGHLEVELTKGTLAAVMAGQERIGLFFAGEGRFTHRSDCPDEFSVLRRDLDRVGHVKPREVDGRITFGDSFSNLLWIEPGRTEAPPPGTAASAAPSGRFDRLRHRFAAILEDGFEQRLAERQLSEKPAPTVWAEFSGGSDDWLYLFDPEEDRSEEIALLQEEQFVRPGRTPELFPIGISEQPIGRSFRAPVPPAVALTRVEAEVTADGEKASVRAVETFDAIEGPRKTLRLNLMSLVRANGRDDVRSWVLDRVADEDGQPVPFVHGNGRVLVELPRPLVPGHPARLTFEMSGDVLYRPSGDSYWLLGFDNWFPQPDLSAQAFSWRCRVRVRKPFLPIASGKQLERSSDGDWNLVTAEIAEPIFLPVVLAGKYHFEEEKIDGRTFRIASYGFANKTATHHLATLAAEVIKFYEPFLGRFPWDEYTIVQIRSLGFGVAPPATMFITDEAFSPHQDDLTKLFSQGLNERYAHEIAHQWWGIQVKWDGPQEQWLSESFAEYCAARLVEKEKGAGHLKSLVADWRRISARSADHSSIALANRLAGEGAFSDRFGLLYGKGPLLLRALDLRLGDETFFTSFKTFLSNRRWRLETTADYENLLEFLTKKSWKEFFDKYYWGTETPTD
jgi:hypothetical protein